MSKYQYTIKNNYLLFWGSHFSNWYPAEFVINNIADVPGEMQFNCVEQYMMYMKAKLFNDRTIMSAVLNTNNPKEQKSLGRKVGGFKLDVWDGCKDLIVYDGCFAKYSQNSDLKKAILETKNLILVEASPYDKIWGIGMAEDDPDATDETKWKGENLLGKALMKVRDTLNEKR